MLLKRSLAKISLVVVLLLPGFAFASEEKPEILLAKVVSGFKTQSYKASAVYVRPSGMDSVDIEHDGEIERITYNEGERSSTVTHFKNSTIQQKDGATTALLNTVRFNPLEHLHTNLNSSLELYNLFISANYDHVAGMPATRLSVISKTNDRYSYIYWVSAESHIILRTDILNENGELIERMVFTSFALKKNGYLDLEGIRHENKGNQISIRHEKTIASNKVTTINSLPSGFTSLLKQSVFDDTAKLLYKHVLLSDGFASIDIYIGNNGHEAKITRGQQLDAFHVFKHKVNGVTVSIEGFLPYLALKKIGLNLVIKNTND